MSKVEDTSFFLFVSYFERNVQRKKLRIRFYKQYEINKGVFARENVRELNDIMNYAPVLERSNSIKVQDIVHLTFNPSLPLYTDTFIEIKGSNILEVSSEYEKSNRMSNEGIQEGGGTGSIHQIDVRKEETPTKKYLFNFSIVHCDKVIFRTEKLLSRPWDFGDMRKGLTDIFKRANKKKSLDRWIDNLEGDFILRYQANSIHFEDCMGKGTIIGRVQKATTSNMKISVIESPSSQVLVQLATLFFRRNDHRHELTSFNTYFALNTMSQIIREYCKVVGYVAEKWIGLGNQKKEIPIRLNAIKNSHLNTHFLAVILKTFPPKDRPDIVKSQIETSGLMKYFEGVEDYSREDLFFELMDQLSIQGLKVDSLMARFDQYMKNYFKVWNESTEEWREKLRILKSALEKSGKQSDRDIVKDKGLLWKFNWYSPSNLFTDVMTELIRSSESPSCVKYEIPFEKPPKLLEYEEHVDYRYKSGPNSLTLANNKLIYSVNGVSRNLHEYQLGWNVHLVVQVRFDHFFSYYSCNTNNDQQSIIFIDLRKVARGDQDLKVDRITKEKTHFRTISTFRKHLMSTYITDEYDIQICFSDQSDPGFPNPSTNHYLSDITQRFKDHLSLGLKFMKKPFLKISCNWIQSLCVFTVPCSKVERWDYSTNGSVPVRLVMVFLRIRSTQKIDFISLEDLEASSTMLYSSNCTLEFDLLVFEKRSTSYVVQSLGRLLPFVIFSVKHRSNKVQRIIQKSSSFSMLNDISNCCMSSNLEWSSKRSMMRVVCYLKKETDINRTEHAVRVYYFKFL